MDIGEIFLQISVNFVMLHAKHVSVLLNNNATHVALYYNKIIILFLVLQNVPLNVLLANMK